MGFLARILGAVSKEERRGIHLDEDRPWRVDPTTHFERFLRALPLLSPYGAVAYFEDTGESHVAEYLERVAISPPVQVAVGTIWPSPDSYHVPLTVSSMEAFALFLEQRPAGYLCSHCHVHREGVILLEWHDAFGQDPMYVSKAIAEDVLAEFAGAIGSAYRSA